MLKNKRYQIFILLIFALLYAPWRGKANRIPQRPTRIATCYLTKNLGDMIFTTPVFRAIKKNLPQSTVSIIGSPRNEEVLKYNPDVDAYIPSPDTVWGLWRQARSLRAEYVFLFMPSALQLATFFLAGTPAICVFATPNTKSETRAYKILRRLCIQVTFEGGSNFAKENLKLLTPLGIHEHDTRKYLYYSPEARRTVDVFMKEKHVNPSTDVIIGVAPGAGTKVKRWPAEKFAALVDYLYESYQVPVFIVGGPGDREEYDTIASLIKTETRIISCLEQTIDELKAFGDLLDIVIANDSAPVYIAEAFGKATVTIVGPTDENEHPPKGEGHAVVMNKDRGVPALKSNLSSNEVYDEARASEQIKGIDVAQVIAATDKILSKLDRV